MFNQRFNDVNIAEMQKKYSKKEVLTYPSVVQRVVNGNLTWVALWLVHGVPQCIQCGSEKEGWMIIDYNLSRSEPNEWPRG